MENRNVDLEFNIEEVQQVVATEIMDDDGGIISVSYSYKRYCC